MGRSTCLHSSVATAKIKKLNFEKNKNIKGKIVVGWEDLLFAQSYSRVSSNQDLAKITSLLLLKKRREYLLNVKLVIQKHLRRLKAKGSTFSISIVSFLFSSANSDLSRSLCLRSSKINSWSSFVLQKIIVNMPRH